MDLDILIKFHFDLGLQYFPLVQMEIESWESKDIPDWLDEIPISKPGSTGK